MTMFQSMNTTASALTAQRLRMDIISSNMANVDTTRGKYVDGEWVPYQRKMVVMQPEEADFSSFRKQFNCFLGFFKFFAQGDGEGSFNRTRCKGNQNPQ